MDERSYSDEALARAIAESHSWRGVLRALGLRATSAGSARSVRRHADRLGLTYEHFTGQRRWTDTALREAVAASSSWLQVAQTLGLAEGGGTLTTLRAHAHRLGIDTDSLGRPALPTPVPSSNIAHDIANLRTAGSMFAATWYSLRGGMISWPLEPCRYDLLVDIGGTVQRIQVKTTVTFGATAVLQVANTRRRGRAVYGPDEIDFFFGIDGELTAYLIPYALIAGYTEIQLGRYHAYIVAVRGSLISESCAPAP